MNRFVLSQKGLQKISDLQDKYRFQNHVEIQDPEDVLQFLRDLKQAEYLGLNVDTEDSDWVELAIDKLISDPEEVVDCLVDEIKLLESLPGCGSVR